MVVGRIRQYKARQVSLYPQINRGNSNLACTPKIPQYQYMYMYMSTNVQVHVLYDLTYEVNTVSTPSQLAYMYMYM